MKIIRTIAHKCNPLQKIIVAIGFPILLFVILQDAMGESKTVIFFIIVTMYFEYIFFDNKDTPSV